MTELATEKQIKFMQSLKVPTFEGLTKNTAKELIQNALEAQDKPEVVKMPPVETKVSKPFNGTAMYVSYAKDIFMGLVGDTNPDRERAKAVMEEAILLVKQAKEAFS